MSPTDRIASRRRAAVGRAAAVLAGLVAAAALAGCSSSRPESSGWLEPYRIDLPQGNYLTGETLAQVRPGFTREQVRSVLGVPLLNPLFRPDRWDYVFRYQHPNGKAEVRNVVILFKDDRVVSIEADKLPEREDPNDPLLPGARRAVVR